MQDSPVEKIRKTFPSGNLDWPGNSHVYDKLKKAADAMGRTTSTHLSYDHLLTMAILGCGHEETMKAHMAWCSMYGWC
jgi:hypothetical protein